MNSTAAVESRNFQRIKVFKGGTIAYSDRRFTLPCVVRNVSETGALIQNSNVTLIPDTFDLIIDLDGLDVECEVMWRSGTKLGVRFLTDPYYRTPARTQTIDISENQTPTALSRKNEKDNTIHSPSRPGEPETSKLKSDCHKRLVHVLIAEDDPDDRYFISEAFELCNVPHEIQFVENGEDLLRCLFALDEYENRPQPDLIFLDLNMPRIDGRTALAEIKSYAETRTIPVIVLTTSSYEDDIANTYDLGVSSYITKPPGLNEFKEILEELLGYWSRAAIQRPVAG